jgi:hypothetical protein
VSPGVATHVPRQSRARWVLLCILALPVAACSNSSPTPQSQASTPPVTSPVSSSSAPTPSVQSLLIAAYEGTYTDVEAAVRKHNSSSPLLAQHAIGPAKYQLQTAVEQYLRLGVVPAGVPALHATVTSLDLSSSPEQATLKSCPAAIKLLDLKTGKPAKSKSLPPNPFTVTLQTVQGRWKVSYFKADRRTTCSG